MSFRETQELRKTGKLEEALDVVTHALREDPDNIWNKRAAAWVYYDYLKKYSQTDLYDKFQETLIKIKDLELSNDEKLVFDNCAWQIGGFVFSLQKEKQVDYGRINAIFELIKGFHFTKPSKAYSFLYKAFHKGYLNWARYLEFADWWNFENFCPEDYLKEEFNSRKMISIVEQAHVAYSKKLLEGVSVDLQGVQKKVDNEKIQLFIPRLDTIIEKYPDYVYPPYFKVKLLLALGRDENAVSVLLPFVRKKKNDFWTWELMAELFKNDEEIQFACYCKALSLDTPEDFLVKIRLAFAGILLEKKMYEEAKTEIELLVTTRSKHEWRLPYQVILWKEQDWYKKYIAKRDNKKLYSQHIKKAEEVLFYDVPEEVVVVESVNEKKKILNFVRDKYAFGFFSYAGHLDRLQIGNVLKVRFIGSGRKGYCKVLTAKIVESHVKTEALKDFEGILKIIFPHNFGFVDDVFVGPELIKNSKLIDRQTVRGKAILSFNKKKNEWGWKAIF